MGWLERTEHTLRRALLEVSALEAIEPILKPQVDLARADLSSEICFRAARSLNQIPAVLAERVGELAAPQIEGSITNERGFLNIRGPRNLRWLSQVEQPNKSPDLNRAVIVVKGAELASARLLARASIQLKLSAPGSRLLLLSAQQLERLDCVSTDWSINWWNQVKLLLSRSSIVTAGQAIPNSIWDSHLSSIKSVTIWAEASLARKSLLKSTVVNLRARGLTLELMYTPARWGSNARHDIDTLLGDNDPETNLARLVYLAGNLCGEELDAIVPGLNERANLVSMLRATSARLSQLSRNCAEALSDQTRPTELVTNILLRCRFLPLFAANAAMYGEVAQLLSVLEDLCRSFQSYFNQPETRRRLNSTQPDCELELVISGVQDALAYILTLFEDHSVAAHAMS